MSGNKDVWRFASRVAILAVAAVALLGLASCQPITYYLEDVYKVLGTVTEEGSGDAVGSVEVIVGDYQYSELTNYYGDYEMEMPEGTWTLHFAKSGYKPYSAEVTVGPEDNQRVRVDVALVPIEPEIDLIGSWSIGLYSAPHIEIFRFLENGTLEVYEDYAETQLADISPWSLDGDILTMFGDETFRVGPLDRGGYRLWNVDDPTDWAVDLNPKGSEPFGDMFDLPMVEMMANTWYEDLSSLDEPEFALFSFTAPESGLYNIRWDDGWDGTGAYTAFLEVMVYASDQETMLLQGEELGYTNPRPVNLNAGETIYVVVESADGDGVTFAIAVEN